MKFTAQAADLAAALGFTGRGIVNSDIPILKTALIRTDGDAVTVTTHTLNTCRSARCPAKVGEADIIAVPVVPLGALIGAMSGDVAVTIAREGAAASVAAGRSRYRLPALPPGDFPALLVPGADAAVLALTVDDVDVLLAAVAEMASADRTRFHLCGVHLTAINGKLAAVATDLRALVRRISSVAAPGWPAITIPTATVTMIERLARLGEENVVLRTDGRLLEARAGGCSFVTKLIGEAFPDHLMPERATSATTFAVPEMQAALERLAAAASGHSAAAGLQWNGNEGALRLCLAHEEGAASDVISAETTGVGCVALSIALMTKTMTATRRDRLRLTVEQRPGATVRFDAPDDGGVVAVIAPTYWRAATSAAAG
jgi:DNA polymerase-3 subunit beta